MSSDDIKQFKLEAAGDAVALMTSVLNQDRVAYDCVVRSLRTPLDYQRALSGLTSMFASVLAEVCVDPTQFLRTWAPSLKHSLGE